MRGKGGGRHIAQFKVIFGIFGAGETHVEAKQIEEMLLELAEQLAAHLGKELVKICIENWMLLPDLAAENERREDDAAPIEEMNVQLGPNAREIRDGHDARLRRELANANNAANKISDLVDRRQRIARL